MNVVFMSPHFPPSWFRFAVALRAVGATTLGIADRNWDELQPELRDALDDYYRIDDMGNYDQLTRALGWFIHRHGRIDRIDSLNEHWLEVEADLRSDFNIPGIDRRHIGAIKRKSLMKSRFEAAGLPVAKGRVCRTERALRRYIDKVGFPVVAKPDIGVGAAKTYKLEREADLERYLVDKLPVDYIVEEYVAGEILTYDGLTDRDGQVVFDSSLTYSTGVMESVNEARDLYYWIPRQIADDVQQMGRRMASAFDVRERPFHFEIFRTPKGKLIPLEVNMRPPGGLTVDMFNYANDIDFYREWANVVVHGHFEGRIERAYACMYVSRRDGRAYVMSHDDVMREFGALLAHQARMDSVFSAAIGDFGYILRDPSLEILIDAAQRIQART